MDHQEAVQLQAAEKYVLGELTPDLCERFEEHYFDCPECAKDLAALTTFMTASRAVFQEGEGDVSAKAPSREEQSGRSGWFNWLRPAIAVPVIAALAALVVFQTTVIIPSAKKQAADQTVAEVYESSYRLQGTIRGSDVAKVAVRFNESFALDFDFTPTQVFPSYRGSLVDLSGQAVLKFSLKGEESNKEVHLVIPGGKVHAGNYELVVVGENGLLNQNPKNNEVLRIPFVVVSGPEIIHSGDRPATKE
jgi:hypothetical protein